VTHSLVKALRAVPDFAALEDSTLLQVVGASANLFWPAGSLVFEPGSPADALYVVLSGRVRVFDLVDGAEHEVSAFGPGGFFGEHSMLLDTVRSKHAQTTEDSELMVVPRESFETLLSDNPDLVATLMAQVEARRRRGDGEAS
jgi:CRP/FNR family cyclic AMP-dependent transcriptional regulator